MGDFVLRTRTLDRFGLAKICLWHSPQHGRLSTVVDDFFRKDSECRRRIFGPHPVVVITLLRVEPSRKSYYRLWSFLKAFHR
jgi:hypothetical protein